MSQPSRSHMLPDIKSNGDMNLPHPHILPLRSGACVHVCRVRPNRICYVQPLLLDRENAIRLPAAGPARQPSVL
eukprot:3733385-Prymnesium_polylepis.1